jgi:HK97 family phage major capsid protein
MGSKLAEKMLVEREQTLGLIRNLERSALESDRDLNDDDIATITRSKTRIADIDRQLEVIGDNLDMDESARERLSRLSPELVEGPVQYRTAGELYWDFLAFQSAQATPEHRDGARRYASVLKRAAEHMGTSAAKTTPTAGGFGGLWVAGPAGPIIDVGPKGRPFLNMVGIRPAPNAMSFTRPRIIDPNVSTGGAAKQTAEKAELVSKKFDFGSDTLNLDTYGGYLNLSQQAISFIPSALDVVMGQLARRVALVTEAAAITELALTTSKVTLAAGAAASAVLAALYDAAVMVFQKTGDMPTSLVAGPLGWAMLGKLVDAAGRPLFPWLGPSNALGTGSLTDFGGMGPLGLEWTVTPAITDTRMWMFNALGFEAWGYQFPVLEAVEPSVLGRQIAVAEAIAFYRPKTAETPSQDGAVLIGP